MVNCVCLSHTTSPWKLFKKKKWLKETSVINHTLWEKIFTDAPCNIQCYHEVASLMPLVVKGTLASALDWMPLLGTLHPLPSSYCFPYKSTSSSAPFAFSKVDFAVKLVMEA